MESQGRPRSDGRRPTAPAERDGDPRYLTGVMTCINKRCQLLGLDAPKDDSLTLKGDAKAPIEFVVGGVNLVTDI